MLPIRRGPNFANPEESQFCQSGGVPILPIRRGPNFVNPEGSQFCQSGGVPILPIRRGPNFANPEGYFFARELKAFLKSSLRKTVHFGLSSRSIRFRNECAAISAPHLVPHPTCTFPKKFCRSERALLRALLDALRLSVLPMAIGLNPPSIFMRAICFVPKKKGLRGSGILPSPLRFISLVSDFRKLSPTLPFDLLTRSLKI